MLTTHKIDSFIIINSSNIPIYWNNIIHSVMGKSWVPNVNKIIIVEYSNHLNKYHSMYGINFKTNIICVIPLYGICSISSDINTLNKYIIKCIKQDSYTPEIANLINYKVFVYSNKPLCKSHMTSKHTKLQTYLKIPLYEYQINYLFTPSYTLKNDNISGILKYYNEHKTKNIQTQTDFQQTKTFITPDINTCQKLNKKTSINTLNSKYNIKPFNFSNNGVNNGWGGKGNTSFSNYMKNDSNDSIW